MNSYNQNQSPMDSYPPPEFYASPYDPKWWLNPPSDSTNDFSPQFLTSQEEDFDFPYEYSHESHDTLCDSPMPSQQFFPSPDDAREFSPQFPISQKDVSDFSPNWYVDDLYDQLRYLEKLPSQSVKNYISEAKSLAYALNRAGAPIDENELIECIIDGLDDSFSGFLQDYYEMNPLFSLDLLSSFLHSHEQLQEPLSSVLPDHHPDPSSTPPQEHQSIDGDTPIDSSLSSSLRVSNSEVIPSSQLIPPSNSLFSPKFDNNESLSLLNKNLYLVVPAQCHVPTSQLLNSFFSQLQGHPHPYSDVIVNSFLVCSSSPSSFPNERMFSLDTSDISYLDGLMEFSNRVHGNLIQEVQDNPYLLLVCKQPSTFQSYWLYAVLLMQAILHFNIHWRLWVFSVEHKVIVLLLILLRGCFTKVKLKLKLRLPTFRLRGCIREIT